MATVPNDSVQAVGRGEPISLTPEMVRSAPKVLLHDHLDGGLRPQTIVELAGEAGHTLPADDAESLGQWFTESADSGSLVRYLETFERGNEPFAITGTAEDANDDHGFYAHGASFAGWWMCWWM